jgi:hypothetical protein
MGGSDTMLKSNGPNLISKDALRDEGCPWPINCTTQEYLVNVGQDFHFNRTHPPPPQIPSPKKKKKHSKGSK